MKLIDTVRSRFIHSAKLAPEKDIQVGIIRAISGGEDNCRFNMTVS